MIERLGRQIGLTPGDFAGLITHGGSLANTTAPLTARNVALGDSWERGLSPRGPPPVLVSHAEAITALRGPRGFSAWGRNRS